MHTSTRTKNRNRLTRAIALLCAFSLLIGTCAYFTDRTSSSASATAGSMDLVFTDISASKTGTNGITSNNEFALDKSWDTSIVSNGGIINPGDYFDLSYQLSNTGSKSMDVRQQLIVTSTVPMTEGAEEYQLTIQGGNDTTVVTGKLSADKLSITYDLKDIILDGSRESETGAVDGKFIVKLDFLATASNAFMGSSASVSYNAQAKQHRNTSDDDWADWADYKTEYEQVTATAPAINSLVAGLALHDYDTGTWYANDAATLTAFGLDTTSITYSTEGLPSDYAVSDGDIVMYEDYEYRYNWVWLEDWMDNAALSDAGVSLPEGWGVRVIDPTKSTYGEIAGHLFGEPVTNLFATFVYCENLTTAPTIPETVSELMLTFGKCTSLTSITIPSNITLIFIESFSGCTSLESIYIPDSVTTIGDSAFYECTSLTSLDLGSGVQTIGTGAFDGCTGLTSVVIPDSVTSIGSYAFSGCTGLTSLNLGSGVQTIGDYAFQQCTGLTSLDLGSGVQTIGDSAFQNCTGLTDITYEGTVEQWNAISLADEWNRNISVTEVICKDGTVTL